MSKDLSFEMFSELLNPHELKRHQELKATWEYEEYLKYKNNENTGHTR